MNKFVQYTLQVLMILLPIGIFGWLVYEDINPSGILRVSYEMGDLSPYVDRLLPDTRVSGVQEEGDDHYVTLTDEPVYFSVHPPKTDYDEIEIGLYMRTTDQPIVEVGPLVDVFSQAYDLAPIQNTLIDDLSWESITEDGMTLLQREPVYTSLSAFLENPPPRDRIATYHYQLETPYRLADYQPLGRERSIDVSLRGFHKYVTYVKNESLVLEATFMDMNRTAGEDEVVLRVWNEHGDLVLKEAYEDDGNETDNQISDRRTAHIEKAGLPEGVYTIELSGTSDIFWRQLTTPQRYVTFVNRLYLGDEVGYLEHPRASTFVTNAKHFVAETYHADATQELRIGGMEISLPKSHEKVYASVEEPGVLSGFSPRGDVQIVGDGKFAFSEDAFFDPDPVRLTALTDFDRRNVDFVVAEYTTPASVDGWWYQTQTFALQDLARSDDALRFTISSPAIVTHQGAVDIHKIELTFKKSPLTREEFFAALRERFPFGL